MVKKYFIFSILLIITCLVLAFPYRHKIKRKFKAIMGYSVKKSQVNTSNCYNCSNLFTDNVKTHNLAFLNDGITPQNKDLDLD